jgi:predicted enzyme related to lactoylglutathione lyase
VLTDKFADSFRFYRDALNLQPLFGEESGVYAEFQLAGDARLAIFRRDVNDQALGLTGGAGSARRFTIVLEVEDVDGTVSQIESRDAKAAVAPVDRPEWGVRTAHFLDPDGNLIEVNQPLRSAG